MAKGSLIALNKDRVKKLNDALKGHFIWIPILSPILTSIGINIYDNSLKKPEPYFDPEDLKRYDNFFESINSATFEQFLSSIFVMFGADLFSGILSYAALDTILTKK